MNIFYLLLTLNFCNSFVLKPKIISTKLYANDPTLWNILSANLKDKARDWFIKRAENKGINWSEMTKTYKNDDLFLMEYYNQIENKNLTYPEYYKRPFHGYDKGNLNWLAAYEGEAATLSMAVNYWEGIDPETTEHWLRYNITENIIKYNIENNNIAIKSILDVGCSMGISTEYLYYSFPEVEDCNGLDLSPYFIAVAKYRSENENLPISYYHRNAEEPTIQKKFDLIVCNFILHEVPFEPSKKILNSLTKMLNPNGLLAVVDLDPAKVQNNLLLSTFRKWAFEVTEPHIYEYYGSNMTQMLYEEGLKNVQKIQNDPINSIWIGYK